AKKTQLYPDNVLFWDTSLIQWDNTNDAGNNTMQVSFGAWSAIDYYLLSMPNFPDFRYRSEGVNSYEGNPTFGLGYPIMIYNGQFGTNADGATSLYVNGMGAPRWRHSNSKVANFAFADGSVRS